MVRKWETYAVQGRQATPFLTALIQRATFIFLGIGLLLSFSRTILHSTPSQIQLDNRNHSSFVSTDPAVVDPSSITSSWCSEDDKRVTGWNSVITDHQCMEKFKKNQKMILNGDNTVIVFKHVHKAGGSTLCQIAKRNRITEDVPLPFRADWTTNCVPYESFLGPHPAVGTSDTDQYVQKKRRSLLGIWAGGACFFGFLTPPQLRALPHHYRPLQFIASEGPLPNEIPLDIPFTMITMLRDPADRALSAYKWFQFMVIAMPYSPTECRSYWAPPNATLSQWLRFYPDNWQTRELAGTEVLYRKDKRNPRHPGPLTPKDVLKAKQRLHYFSLILIMERPEASEALLRWKMGWKDVDFQRDRTGSLKNSSARNELRDQPELLRQLLEKNRYDTEIYEYALKLHELQVQEMKES